MFAIQQASKNNMHGVVASTVLVVTGFAARW